MLLFFLELRCYLVVTMQVQCDALCVLSMCTFSDLLAFDVWCFSAYAKLNSLVISRLTLHYYAHLYHQLRPSNLYRSVCYSRLRSQSNYRIFMLFNSIYICFIVERFELDCKGEIVICRTT